MIEKNLKNKLRKNMKIMVIGSMTFAKEMLQTKQELEKLGYAAEIPFDVEYHVSDEGAIDDLEKNFRYCIENDVVRKGFQQVVDADAILVLNLPKNGISGYIGTSALMEMGIAHWLYKKIFLLNEPPKHTEHRWAHEVKIMQPVILNGDLTRISA